MSDGPIVSAIVVSWNVRESLEQCLAALSTSVNITHETIVVDNASYDGTREMLAAHTECMGILNTQNRGFAAAVNQGVQRARGKIIVLVNPDVVVYPDTLAHIAAQITAHRQLGVLGGKTLNADGTIQRSVHRLPSFADQALTLLKLSTPLRETKIFQHYLAADFSYDAPADVEQVEGALFAFSRSTYDTLHGFDQKYFLWFEEVDFCKRVRQKGLRVVFDPMVCAQHAGGMSTRQLSALRRHLLYQRSMLRYFKKFHAPQHLALLPFAIVGTCVAAILSILPGSFFRKFMRPTYAAK